jgi:uncharacterized protein (TIGR03067 family)
MRGNLLAMAIVILVASFVVPIPAGEKDDAVAKDLKLLQGNWVLQSFMTKGKDVPADTIKNIKLTIKGHRYLAYFGEKKMELAIKIDPTKKPKAIDFIMAKGDKKVTTRGIYEIKGDTFKLCRGTEAGQDRPTEFTAKEGTGLVIAVYKRHASQGRPGGVKSKSN